LTPRWRLSSWALAAPMCAKAWRPSKPNAHLISAEKTDCLQFPSCKLSDNCAITPASCWCGLLCLWAWPWRLPWRRPRPPSWCVPAAACSNWWLLTARTAPHPATHRWTAPCVCPWLCRQRLAQCNGFNLLLSPMPCSLLQRRILRRPPRRRCLLAGRPHSEHQLTFPPIMYWRVCYF